MPRSRYSTTAYRFIPMRRAARHLLLFTALWLLFTRADPGSWILGILVVPLATWLSLSLFSHNSRELSDNKGMSIYRLLRFLPFFLHQSLRGGWETARLALHPGLPIHPGFIHFQTRLTTVPSRVFFSQLVSLLPGSVGASLVDDQLKIHVLADPDERALRECEEQVATLFGLALEPRSVAIKRGVES